MNPSPDQLRALLARRQSVVAEQHQRLARKIHDEVSQKLTILALQLSFEASGSNNASDWPQKCHDWSTLVIGLCRSVREINDDLQPRILEELGLSAVLEWYARTHGTDLRFSFTPPSHEIPLPPGVAAELFIVCRELLTQLFPRIGATHVHIKAEQSDGLLWLHLRGDDNGFGRKTDPERDLDVLSLHERVMRLGGSVQLATAPRFRHLHHTFLSLLSGGCS